MKCGICLVIKIENDEYVVNECLLKWAQLILKHLNVNYQEPLMVCAKCSKRLQEIQEFAEFIKQCQLVNQKTLATIKQTEEQHNNDIKLEYFPENEENTAGAPYIIFDHKETSTEVPTFQESSKPLLTTLKQNIDDINSEFSYDNEDKNIKEPKIVFENEEIRAEEPEFDIDDSDNQDPLTMPLEQDFALHTNSNNKGKQKCVYCKEIFQTVRELTCHISAKHYERKKVCKICCKEFPYQRELLRHIKEKHKNLTSASNIATEDLKCQICPKSFDCQGALQSHLTCVHGERVGKYVCEICGQHFPYEKSLECHMTLVHNAVDTTQEDLYNRTCVICNKLYKSLSTLRFHFYQIHKDETPHACHACDLKFKFYHTLRRHLLEVHFQSDANALSEEDRHCNKCNISFKTLKALKTHMETMHKGERPFSCDKCSMEFSLRIAYRRHVNELCRFRNKSEKSTKSTKLVVNDNRTLQGNSSKDHAINFEGTAEEELFDEHVKTIANDLPKHDEDKNQLDECSKSKKLKADNFKEEPILSIAKKKREKKDREYNLVCCICDRKFRTFSSLRAHMYRIHKHDKPFVCKKCNHSYRFQHELEKHKCTAGSDDENGGKSTKEEKLDRICKICQKLFGTIGSLREHMYTRHKFEKPHSCEICGMDFRFSDKLRKHVADVHSQSSKEEVDDRTCVLCNICYKSIGRLRHHMHMRHKGVKPFNCNHCGQSYNMIVVLKQHFPNCVALLNST